MMITRWLALLCATISFVPGSSAQTGPPGASIAAATRRPSTSSGEWETPEVRAVLDRNLYPVAVKIGATQGGSVAVEADLQNFSAKTITAYGALITARYADGSERSAGKMNQDVLVDTVLSRIPGMTLPSSAGTLNPHEIRAHKEAFPLDSAGLPPTSATAKVSMIIFEDGTALGDPWAVRVTFEGCKKGLPERGTVLAEVRKALDNPDVQRSSGTDQLKALQGVLGARIAEIKGAGSGGWTADGLRDLQDFHDSLAHNRLVFDMMMLTAEALQEATVGQCTPGGPR